MDIDRPLPVIHSLTRSGFAVLLRCTVQYRKVDAVHVPMQVSILRTHLLTLHLFSVCTPLNSNNVREPHVRHATLRIGALPVSVTVGICAM